MSQNNALPSASAICSSLTNSERFEGPGTGTSRRSPGRFLRSASRGGSGTLLMMISSALSGPARMDRAIAATQRRDAAKHRTRPGEAFPFIMTSIVSDAEAASAVNARSGHKLPHHAREMENPGSPPEPDPSADDAAVAAG